MARPLRLEYAGALYHITSRGDDRKMFISLLEQVCKTYNWLCHAYCLMGNHYHLLVETPEANLSKGMRQLNGMYTQNYNRNHNRVGHVFQGRYKAILVEKQSYLLELARYIVLNPVRVQMVRVAGDWQWSSYRATIGQSTRSGCLTTDWLLAAFSNRKGKAIELYKQFVHEGKGQPALWSELRSQIYLGSEEFIEKIQAHIDIIEAYQSGGYTLKQIGDHFGLHYSTVSGIVRHHKSKT